MFSNTQQLAGYLFLRLVGDPTNQQIPPCGTPTIAFRAVELVHRTRRITRGSGRLSTT